MPYPFWLYIFAWAFLSLALLCALITLVDEFFHPQKMFIMNLVWPITALYWGPVALWAYFKAGRKMTKGADEDAKKEQEQQSATAAQIAVSTSHCGAGCTLGDIAGESCIAAFALQFAGSEFTTRLVTDFILAWIFGIVFQYFSIVPMRNLSPGEGAIAAVRADTFSIIAFQIGMFGWMALTYFVIFPDPHLRVNDPVFWFMMQVAMMIGYFTSWPANVALLKIGWKEKMG